MRKVFFLCSLSVLAVLFIMACSSDDRATIENPVGTSISSNPAGGPNSSEGTVETAGGSGNKKGTGGIKVDDDSSECDPDREDNTICSSSTAYVWLNTAPEKFCGSGYTYEIYNDGDFVTSGGLTFDQDTCESNYWWAFFDPPGGADDDTYTIVVYSNCTGHSVGRDTYRRSCKGTSD